MRVRGNGFLYNMVRIIAGTLLEVRNGTPQQRNGPEGVSHRRADAGRTNGTGERIDGLWGLRMRSEQILPIGTLLQGRYKIEKK